MGTFKIFVLDSKKKREKIYECKDCELLFEDNMQLNKHRQIHNNKEYCCDECDCKFNTSKLLLLLLLLL